MPIRLTRASWNGGSEFLAEEKGAIVIIEEAPFVGQGLDFRQRGPLLGRMLYGIAVRETRGAAGEEVPKGDVAGGFDKISVRTGPGITMG